MVKNSPGMNEFRSLMFSRLMPNLRELGLVPERMLRRYESAGLLHYMLGKSAPELTAEDLLNDLDRGRTVNQAVALA